VGDKTVISGLRWYASDKYGQLIMVGGVACDLSQTGVPIGKKETLVLFELELDQFHNYREILDNGPNFALL